MVPIQGRDSVRIPAACVILALLGVLGLPGMATAATASFDCKLAASKIEKAICGDAALGKADVDLAAAFTQAMQRLSGNPQAELRNSQRDWLRQHGKACNPADPQRKFAACLKARFLARIDELASWNPEKPPEGGRSEKAAYDPEQLPRRVTEGDFDVRWGEGVAVSIDKKSGKLTEIYRNDSSSGAGPTGASTEANRLYSLRSIVGPLVSYLDDSTGRNGANGRTMKVIQVVHLGRDNAETLVDLVGEPALYDALLAYCAQQECGHRNKPADLNEAVAGLLPGCTSLKRDIFAAYSFAEWRGDAAVAVVMFGHPCSEAEETVEVPLVVKVPASLTADFRAADENKTLGKYLTK